MTNQTNEVGKRYLRWMAEHGEYHPNPDDFLKDKPEINGQVITEAELAKAVLRAEHLGLIKGHHASGRDMPLRVRLLPPGDECAEDYDGNMRAWSDARQGGGTVTYNQGTNYSFEGISGSSVVAGSKNVEQHQTQTTITVEDADLLHRVGLASQELANLVPGAEGAQELREAATEVQSTAKDPGKAEQAGKAGKRLKGALTTIGALASLSTLSKFLMDNLDLAVAFE